MHEVIKLLIFWLPVSLKIMSQCTKSDLYPHYILYDSTKALFDKPVLIVTHNNKAKKYSPH